LGSGYGLNDHNSFFLRVPCVSVFPFFETSPHVAQLQRLPVTGHHQLP